MRACMSREDWYDHIESVPVTGNQLGRIIAEYRRLGLGGAEDRAGRLAITAALAGTGELDSTRDLTQGQAGRVVHALLGCPDQASLYAAAGLGADRQAAGEPDRDGISLGKAIILAIAVIIDAWHKPNASTGAQNFAAHPAAPTRS